ncbi:aldose 1-epimerase family protein [Ructibacterium gallinarum]|uniref:Aldose 1-epimerase family protein n=1 Tax=Ructibacterium gallinarum TaxID=2779355 RepID=A0A9D5M0V3_9FIRM|nr:aldose 1-epimerase family protein [Ructibacterium gallinarum]MBE5039383.1 aldose 1-epimerase family protein [Ructibacterium gallinarum]
MNKYIGNELQLWGVEEAILVSGKANGMRILNVRNGKGLEFTVSLDRGADISRVIFKGDNMGYFAPCGYVSSKYYDSTGDGFLKSFTAGFLTTCGLTAVGTPCVDNGETLPLHGTISNTPCDNFRYWTEDGKIHIKTRVQDAALFSHKLVMEREYICPLDSNSIYLIDEITNIGSVESPLQVLYHCNMGYPLLSENAVVTIPSDGVTPRNKHAIEGLEHCLQMEKPQRGYQEKCYYHKIHGIPRISIFNSNIGKGVSLFYDTKELPYFTEWKMMGEYEYVLGLEPGNCLPDGRDVMRKQKILEFLKPDETKIHHIKFEFMEEAPC